MTVTHALERFFAVLAIAAFVGALVLWVARLFGRRNAALAGLVDSFGELRLPAAALVAFVCMGGSLYFSQVAHFAPCRLCWIQRGFMYPLAVLLTLAALRRSVGVRKIAIPMAIAGAAVSSYHVLIERYPQLESSVCDINVPCNQIWFQEFGFITIPVMALCGFAFIATVLALPLAHRSPA